MWKMFQSYDKRDDGGVWNRSALVGRIADDLRGNSDVSSGKNWIHASRSGHVWLEFEQQRHVDDNMLSFSVMISLSPEGFDDKESQDSWNALHLEDFKSPYVKPKQRPLSIRKDERYESSVLHKSFVNFYSRLIHVLTDKEDCFNFLNGTHPSTENIEFSIWNLDKPVAVNYVVAGYTYAQKYSMVNYRNQSLQRIRDLSVSDSEAKKQLLFLQSINRLNPEISEILVK